MLLRQVRRCIEREHLVDVTQVVYVAVSGGADSVALLTALYMLGYHLEVLHCNFELRGIESDEDELFVKHYAQQLGLPYQVKSFDTSTYAQRHKVSIEMAARELRYAWFTELLSKNPDRCVALGHTANDMSETFLYNLSQGTGIRGLSGIPYKKGTGIIRPLLDTSREQVIAFLQTNPHINVWREDKSNTDIRFRRNYIRHKLLPCFEELKLGANLQIRQTIRQLRGAELFYQSCIAQYKAMALSDIGIHIPTVLTSPHAETLLFELLYPYGFSSAQCYAISEKLPSLPSGAKYQTTEYRLIRSWDYLELLPLEPIKRPELDLSNYTYPTYIPYEGLGLYLKLSEDITLRDDRVICLPLAMIQGRKLGLRGLREGDKIQPFGMKKGSKRLSRILLEKKATHRQREEALVLTLDEEILWLIGWAKSERTRIHTSVVLGPYLSITIVVNEDEKRNICH